MLDPLKRLFRGIRAAPKRPHAAVREPAPSPAAAALYDKAVRHYEEGALDEAVALLAQAIGAKHNFARAHFLLGEIHRRRGELDDAADCYRLASAFEPALSEAHAQLGAVFVAQGRYADALEAVQRAATLAPGEAAICNLLGTVLIKLERPGDAVEQFRRALALDPRSADAHSNLGYVLLRYFEQVEEGAAHIEAALGADPQHADALCNRVMALQYRGRLREALALSEQLLERGPDDQLQVNRALMLLALGDFARGWDAYEARKHLETNAGPRPLPCPEWNGEPLGDKTLLVQGEQGLGDQIMFASCFNDLAALAPNCLVESDARLTPIFARSFPHVRCYETREEPHAWAKDAVEPAVCVKMGSLPRLFRRDLSAFPRRAGYLHADPLRVEHWKARLAELPGTLKVGISWRGGIDSTRRALRSIPLDEWAAVLRVPGVDFVSLQYADCRDELASVERSQGVRVQHWQEAIDDYEATAALVTMLDLIISVQTAVVHLAGALGRNVWALIAAIPEWRYLATGGSMSWYPGVRLIRQSEVGVWAPVLERVGQELAVVAARAKGGCSGC